MNVEVWKDLRARRLNTLADMYQAQLESQPPPGMTKAEWFYFLTGNAFFPAIDLETMTR